MFKGSVQDGRLIGLCFRATPSCRKSQCHTCRGVRLIGTSDQAKQNIFEADLKGPIGLVVGAEGTGIRRLTADNCDQLINIPMSGKVECLNVSTTNFNLHKGWFCVSSLGMYID